MSKSLLIKFDLTSQRDKDIYSQLSKARNKTEYIKTLIENDAKGLSGASIQNELRKALSDFFGSDRAIDQPSGDAIEVKKPIYIEETVHEPKSNHMAEPVSEVSAVPEYENNDSDNLDTNEPKKELNDSALAFLASIGSAD